jgi:hypothetical protein
MKKCDSKKMPMKMMGGKGYKASAKSAKASSKKMTARRK